MATLNRKGGKKRSSIPKSKFALPKGSGPDTGKNQYPVDTTARAQNAKARAAQQYKKGNLTKSQKDKVVRKANAKLKKKR
jgi:hypothetical protein